MITRIETKHYRCFKNIGVDVPRYAVLVGSNGAGKTTFLDIPRLLGDCLGQEDINPPFMEGQQGRGARCSVVPELVYRGEGNEFFIALEAELHINLVRGLVEGFAVANRDESFWPRFIRYELRLGIGRSAQLRVKNEYLFLFSEKNRPVRDGARMLGDKPHRDWRLVIRREGGGDALIRAEAQRGARVHSVKVKATSLALRRILSDSSGDYLAASWLCDLLTQNFLFYQPDLKSMQVASPPGLPAWPLAPAANLPHLALALQERDSCGFKFWENRAKIAFRGIERIAVKKRADGHAYFCIRYQGGYTVTSAGLSEGVLRFLALTILPHLSNPPKVIFVEKPENGMHPGVIELVLKSLAEAYDSQVLFSTNSPVTVDNSQMSQLLCLRQHAPEGETIIAGSDHPQFSRYDGPMPLGQFFATGMFE